MNKIAWMIKTKDGYEPIGESTMTVSTTQIEFLAKCVSMAVNNGFCYGTTDLATSALTEFGFNDYEIKKLYSGNYRYNGIGTETLDIFFADKFNKYFVGNPIEKNK